MIVWLFSATFSFLFSIY